MNSPLLYAAPIFVASIGVEFFYLQKLRREKIDYPDAIASITMGLGDLLEMIFFGWVTLGIYSYFYQYRFYTMPASVGAYLLLIVLEDYCYYWFHRVSHVCRFWWSAHETHHSSDQYNLSTALRQSWTGFPIIWPFWIPLLLMGFPPLWVVLQQSISLFYQFFIHTRVVKRLGPLEWVMNTPSHHRVHHATDVPYLDRNYAGIFIIWDRLHGTFVEETTEPHYGVLSGFRSTNPVRIGFHMWTELFRDLFRSGGVVNAFKVLFYPPGWSVEHGWQKTTRALKSKGN